MTPSSDAQTLVDAARSMSDQITHRGPDDAGDWADERVGVAFGFRRLSIIDVSDQGHQPMVSASGRFTIVFNGEVYNYRELRHDLEQSGARFRGHSDTEVILAAFERWGIESSVSRFIGMFGIAVWDRDEPSLTLIRDRLGIKPLYVYAEPGFVSFGSELKALVAGPRFDRTLDLTAVTAFLRHLYVPGPRTIYQRVIKLPPGHVLTLVRPEAPLPESRPYWSPQEAADRGQRTPFTGSEREAVEALDALLHDAVKLRMRSDVPLGALLSGGIDSSTVTAMMQDCSERAVKTFSIGFDRDEHNEAPAAARVARHLGTDHTQLMLTGEDALALIPRLPDMFDEPFADPSMLPTYLVSELARRDVTVALSGDGGDELFGGYNRYILGERLLERVARIPRPIRRVAAAGIGSVSPTSWDRVHRAASPMLPSKYKHRLPGAKLHKFADLMTNDSIAHMYQSLLSAWKDPGALVENGDDRDEWVTRVLAAPSPTPLSHRMMLADQGVYLPDDLLAKVDRASMATSLEVRVPLLDHRVVEFAWTLPLALKIRKGEGKWVLRQVLYGRVPRTLVDRPKMGFSIPIDDWLRGPLRVWGEEVIAGSETYCGGVLRGEPIRRAWREFLNGQRESGLALWAVLMFHAWHERWS